MKKTLSIRLDRSMRKELELLSKEGHVSISTLVRDILRNLIGVREFRRIRKKILPIAEANGFITDEDVFRKIS